jgi:hypothetical protein
MIAVVGHWKAREFDCRLEAILVNKVMIYETRAHGDLGALDVVRGEECI